MGREEATEGLMSQKMREELQTGGENHAVEKCLWDLSPISGFRESSLRRLMGALLPRRRGEEPDSARGGERSRWCSEGTPGLHHRLSTQGLWPPTCPWGPLPPRPPSGLCPAHVLSGSCMLGKGGPSASRTVPTTTSRETVPQRELRVWALAVTHRDSELMFSEVLDLLLSLPPAPSVLIKPYPAPQPTPLYLPTSRYVLLSRTVVCPEGSVLLHGGASDWNKGVGG